MVMGGYSFIPANFVTTMAILEVYLSAYAKDVADPFSDKVPHRSCKNGCIDEVLHLRSAYFYPRLFAIKCIHKRLVCKLKIGLVIA